MNQNSSCVLDGRDDDSFQKDRFFYRFFHPEKLIIRLIDLRSHLTDSIISFKRNKTRFFLNICEKDMCPVQR